VPDFSAPRSRLNDRGFTPQHVIVTGDEATEPPLEGALRLREHGNGFVIESVDYGSGLPVATAPDAEGAAEVHRFVTRAAIRVGVRIVEPWFGRPGGALVFLMQEPGFAIRDALASGHLERITIER
jgi:hypothetical protein